MQISNFNRPVLFALILTAALVFMAIPAFAITYYPSQNGYANMAVACDGTTVKSGATVAHNPSGTYAIKQIDAELNSSSWVSGRSGNGNELQFKLVSDGDTAVWTNVITNNYTTRARRSGAYQCNGWLPGYGNYTLSYRVQYN